MITNKSVRYAENLISRKARRRLHTAMMLADRGISIVPLRANSKEPSNSGGSRFPLTTIGDVKRYFTLHPNHNYGIATGGPSGLMIVDVDGEKGEKSSRALCEQYGPLSSTLEVRTGRGRHLYFRASGVKIKNSVAKLGVGLDIRGEGGYGVGPHCRHPNGKFYEPTHLEAVMNLRPVEQLF